MAKSIRLLKDESGNENLKIGIHHLDAGHIGDKHWHDYYEMEIIIKGSGAHYCNGKILPLIPGTAYLTTYHDIHSITVEEEIWILHITFLENLLPPSIASYVSMSPNLFTSHLSKEKTEYFLKRCERLSMEVQCGLLFSETNFRSLPTEILVTILRDSPLPVDQQPHNMQRAIAYIHRHFNENLQLKTLAAHLNLSPNYCGNLFTRTFDTTFNKYLLNVRLKAACRLLTTSELSIAAIAKECGFNSTEYFFQSFKKEFGFTPAFFRTQPKR